MVEKVLVNMKKILLTLQINNNEYTKAVNPTCTLLDFIREEINLTGTKRGCDDGECGCCSVLVDKKPILSCITLAVEMQGKHITTIEGVGTKENPHVLQKTMVEEGAIQCGFCTPAMVINGISLLEKNTRPTSLEIKKCISGTICRCTGYTKIEKAISVAATELGEL